MSFRGHLRPGQGAKKFRVWKRESGLTKTGRPQTSNLVESGEIIGMITRCDPKEAEQFRQEGHPITDTIVQRGSKNKAGATDILEMYPQPGVEKSRFFRIQAIPRDPGGLGHFTVYKALERSDLE